jgi:hypothetical protein
MPAIYHARHLVMPNILSCPVSCHAQHLVMPGTGITGAGRSIGRRGAVMAKLCIAASNRNWQHIGRLRCIKEHKPLTLRAFNGIV